MEEGTQTMNIERQSHISLKWAGIIKNWDLRAFVNNANEHHTAEMMRFSLYTLSHTIDCIFTDYIHRTSSLHIWLLFAIDEVTVEPFARCNISFFIIECDVVWTYPNPAIIVYSRVFIHMLAICLLFESLCACVNVCVWVHQKSLQRYAEFVL